MTIVAGMLAGVLMGLIFAAHLSVMWVMKPPAFVRNAPDGGNLMTITMAVHLAGFFVWPVIGITAALAFSIAHREFPSEAPGLPSLVYTGAVLAIVLAMAPPILILARSWMRHLLAQFGIFFVIFGLVIPILVQGPMSR